MIVNTKTQKSKISFIFLLRFGFILLSVAAVFGFMRYSLVTQAKNYVQDFTLQNSVDLSQGEVFPIARKLGAIAKKEQFICIAGTKKNIIFFEDKKANCTSGLFQTNQELVDRIQDIQIRFTIRMPQEIILGLLIFLGCQAGLVILMLFGERKNLLDKLKGEIAMAAVARQIGHDIRSPLAVLRFATKDKNLNSLRETAINRLQELSTHLLKKEEDVLHLATVQSLVREICREKRVEFGSEIQIFETISLDKEYFLPGNAFYWRRIFSNLINNAVEARGDGVANVHIHVSAAADFIEVSIKDSGQGMSPDVLEGLKNGIFTHGKKFGTGLGLSSAKTYLEKVGGTLQIESSIGNGCTVRMRFPKLDRIVLIDDDAEFGDLWQVWAQQRGISFQFIHCKSKEELLRQVESISLGAIVFLDKNLGNIRDYRSLAQAFQKKSMKQIYLCSGEGDLGHDLPDWITGKVRKEPPNLEKPLSNC